MNTSLFFPPRSPANPAGSTTSASATLTVNRAFFSGGQEVAVSYLTPQQTAGPASVSFSMVFSGRTYAAANGETASDQIVSYAVTRPGGERQGAENGVWLWGLG